MNRPRLYRLGGAERAPMLQRRNSWQAVVDRLREARCVLWLFAWYVLSLGTPDHTQGCLCASQPSGELRGVV